MFFRPAFFRISAMGGAALLLAFVMALGFKQWPQAASALERGLALPQAQTSTDWPQLQYGPKRTGHNPQALRGPFSERWQQDLGIPLADRMQPVIAGGLVIVGDIAGTVHALDEATGNSRWTFQTTGSILYSAAIDNGTVFVGSHDGNVYALNLTDGNEVWQAPVLKGIGGAPLVWGNRVYASGKDGYLYAFAAETGAQLWQFDTAATTPASVRAPILSSPAIYPSKNLIFFAAENLKAYALNATTGALVWAAQMYGESAYDSWPVVSESQNMVMFRTKSVYSFHASLVLDEEDLFCPGDTAGACSSCANLDPANFNAADETVVASGVTEPQWNEQHLMNGDNAIDSIDEILATYPHRATFYAFDPDTGNAKWTRPAPILWTAGGGRGGIMPVVNDTTGAIYTMWRTKYSRRDVSYFCRKWVDVGQLTVRDSLPTVDFLPCFGGGANCPSSQDFHFIADETTVLSLAGDLLVMAGWYNAGGLNVIDGSASFIVGTGYGLPEGGAGTGGDSAVPVSIANKTIFVKHHQGFPAVAAESTPYTIVAAYQGQ